MARRPSSSAISDVAPVATSKSRAEVSALRHLREAYEALGTRVGGAETASSTPQGKLSASSSSRINERPLSSRCRVLDTVRALQQSAATPTRSPEVVDHWLVLETLAQAIESDAAALEREVHAAQVRTSSALQLPAEGFETLDAKLLVMSEVLGREAFNSYAHDLFHELATLRQRCLLYGNTLKQFQEQVQLRCIGAHRMRDVLSHTDWLEIANASLSALGIAASSPLLVSHIPVTMQHCSPSRSTHEGESSVVVVELLQLLERLPPARERLVSLCFEQIGDVRRGAGLVPPPEGIRPHKLAALAKQSHADTLCARDERDRILTWLNEGIDDNGTVNRSEFLAFHVSVSDKFVDEDAEFVSFLMRLWQFELPHNLGIGDVVADYEARCQDFATMVRKREVLKKLDHVRAVLPPRLASLRHLVGQVETVSLQSAEQFQRLTLHQQLITSTLLGLRVLRLSGLSLLEFPVFVVTLPLLEELHLGDNQLRDALPLVTIGSMKKLQKLVLSDNFLSDASFVVPSQDAVWHGLSNLTTLDLSRNQLTLIPGLVVGLARLKHLTLVANKLRDRGLASGVESKWTQLGFPKLQTLDVRDNELSTLPEVVFTTGKMALEALFVQDNHLADVPSSFHLLENLRDAVFSRNRLKELGTSDVTSLVLRCQGLRELTLDHNQLKLFPFQPSGSQPSSIHGLRAIRCAKNRLRILPALGTLVFHACEELDLRDNALTEISEAFFPAFPILKFCYLQQNAISRLPISISQCLCLQVLEAYENKLESVPASLATLKDLAVLNLRENQLAMIPTEWHAFAQHLQRDHHSKPRTLQTLYLQRNPLRNKVLQTLVDGGIGGGGGRAAGSGGVTPFKSSTTQICELYVRKLIDTLKESVAVQRLATAVHSEMREEDSDEGEDDRGGQTKRRKRRWKGRARFVLQHMEAQLSIKCEATDEGRTRLQLTTNAFQKLLQKLLVSSTKKELRLMSDRFLWAGSVESVDGWAFLCGVEAVGLFNNLPAVGTESSGGTDPARCESVRKPVDTVASILQYLQVAHDHKLKGPPVEDPAPVFIPIPRESRPRSAPAKAYQAPRPQSAKNPRDTKPKSSGRDERQENAHHRTALEQQRQRIHVLEQQLLDQQLLRLAEQKAHRVVPNAPPSEPLSRLGDSREIHPAKASASVLVYIKQLNRDDQPPGPAELVVIAMPRDATGLQLKQAITTRLGIEVSRQVLIAKTTGSAARDHERLHDGTMLIHYCQHLPAHVRWHVSLIVSDRLSVDWSKLHPDISTIASRECSKSSELRESGERHEQVKR